MRLLASVFYMLAAWLLRPLLRLMRFGVVPEHPLDDLGLDPARPVCYVLPARSWIDWFALERICLSLGLPRPVRTGRQLPSVERSGCLYLPALLETRLRTTALSAPMRLAAATAGYDVQLVPVSIFWGRNPGQETSLFRLVFADSPQAGAIRKFFITLANGQNVLAHFGKPLSYRAYEAEVGGAAAAQRKLGRVLHFHFLHVRTATLGPTLVRRSLVIADVLNASGVRHAIEREVREKRLPQPKVEARARKLAHEIAADYSSATLRVLEHLFTWVWHRVFKGIEVRGLERVRELAQSHAILYLPSHRSHADYLLVSYVLYGAGLVPPHIAAGINLNFWPVGGLLRRGGAFYIRRKFSGDVLYAAVFRAYVDSLVRRGYPIEFFPEGGRSRTGRLLPPKTGMMSMVMESALRQRVRKMAVVPVFIGYDKVWEVGSYFKELQGAAKQSESAEGLLKAGKILRKSYGRAYISFGEPRVLQDAADARLPGWRETMDATSEARPEGFPAFVSDFSVEHMRAINRAAAVSPVSLSACALLATARNVVAQDALVEQLGHLAALLEGWPGRDEILLPKTSPEEQLDWAIPIARMRRLEHTWGDLLATTGRDAVLLTYGRNNIQHLFALPSLIATLFRSRGVLADEYVVTACRALYPFLRNEFFLPWERTECESAARRYIELMVGRGLLERGDDGRLHRPEVGGPAFGAVMALAGILGETLERLVVVSMLLAEERHGDLSLQRNAVEEDCRALAERLALLTGREAPEFFDKTLFRGYLDTLISLDVGREIEGGGLVVDERIGRIATRSLALLGDETRQTLLQLLARRRAARRAPDAAPI